MVDLLQKNTFPVPAVTPPETHLPLRSDLDVDGCLSVPEDGDLLLWEMNHCEVSGRPDEHPLLPVNHTGRILWGNTWFNGQREATGLLLIILRLK